MKTPIQLTQDKVMELAKAETDPSKSIILTEVFGHLTLMEELEKRVITDGIYNSLVKSWGDEYGRLHEVTLESFKNQAEQYYNETFENKTK